MNELSEDKNIYLMASALGAAFLFYRYKSVLCSGQELVPIAENAQEHDPIATSLDLVKLIDKIILHNINVVLCKIIRT